jgi:hypothetical protein
MLEREFEDVLSAYPELIEDGLSLKGRQVNTDRKFIDLLFKDKIGQDLIVELKIGVAKREHVAQLLDYAGYKIAEGKVPVRIMLIANRIPENFKHSFDYFGFEYKEIAIDKLHDFLRNKNDQNLLKIFEVTAEREKSPITEAIAIAPPDSKQGIVKMPTNKSDRNETRQAMASRIKSGQLFKQAKCAIELLNTSQGPVDMKKIISFMSTKGYHSKTYYDLFNSLVDSDLVEQVSVGGRKAYRLRKDE